VKVLVSGTITAGDTSISLLSGQGALLPDPSVEGSFRLVLFDASTYADPTDDASAEDVTVTAIVADTLTVDPVANNHLTSGVQYVMYLSFDKEQIDSIDDYLQDMSRTITSVTHNANGQVATIITGTRTYTLTYDGFGEIATVTTNDTPAKVYTVTRDSAGNLSSITFA